MKRLNRWRGARSRQAGSLWDFVAAPMGHLRRSRAKVAAALETEGASQRPDVDPVVVSIEAKLRRAGKGKRFVIENGAWLLTSCARSSRAHRN